MKFTSKHFLFQGRRNGKYLLSQRIQKVCVSKKYKPFKELQKGLKNLYISYDLSSGKDLSVKTTMKRHGDTWTVLNVEVVD